MALCIGDITGNFIQRMEAHFRGHGCRYTKNRPPLYIVGFEGYKDKKQATQREMYLKTNKGRQWLKDNHHCYKPIHIR